MIDLRKELEKPERPLGLVELSGMLGVTYLSLADRARRWGMTLSGDPGNLQLSPENSYFMLAFFASCTEKDIRKEFRIGEDKVKDLCLSGELVSYQYRGRTRIFLYSVDRFREKQQADTTIANPDARGLARYSKERLREILALARATPLGFVSIPRLAAAMKVSESVLYDQKKSGGLKTVAFGKSSYVPMADACQLVKAWRRSCTPMEATALAGMTSRMVYGRMEKGTFETVTIFGHARVLRCSIGALKEWKPRVSPRAKESTVTAGEAAEMFRLPIWQALPILARHIDKRAGGSGSKVYLKTSVEKFVAENSKLLLRIRIGEVRL